MRKIAGKSTSGCLRGVIVAIAASLALVGCAHLGPNAEPAQAKSFNASKLSEIDAAVAEFITQKKLPGAAFHLERGGVIYQKAYGAQTYADSAPATTTTTVYDAASLTKVVATTPAVMMLIESGQLKLDAPLTAYLPECDNNDKSAITIRHLLTHTSGLAAGISAAPAWRGEAEALKRACDQKPTNPPGTLFRYSDINFILLGLIVQRVSGMPLDVFTTERVFKPLGMRDTGYLPLKRMSAARIAPTQIVKESDGAERVLQGEVHDPTARRMGGVAGHAGLFTTVGDLSRYARMMLGEGALDGVRVLSVESVRLLRSVQTPTAVSARRGLGWDIDSPYARPRGQLFPIGSYGHTGFTGCILWIDPFSQTIYAFLSNRVYPKDGAGIVALYATLGTLSAGAVSDFDFASVVGALPAVMPVSPVAPVAPVLPAVPVSPSPGR